MPTYFSLGTQVRLSASSLSASTTANPTNKKTAEANRNGLNAEAAIQNGRFLAEEIVPDKDDSGLRFLGEDRDMPFYLARVGFEFSDPTSISRPQQTSHTKASPARPIRQPSRTSSRASTENASASRRPPRSRVEVVIQRKEKEVEKQTPVTSKGKRSVANQAVSLTPIEPTDSTVPPPSQFSPISQPNLEQTVTSPQALTLTVFLSPKSFLPTSFQSRTVQDIKIDVFFNGEFTSSSYVPARHKNDPPTCRDLMQRFSGRRAHVLVEHAWVLAPPTRNADGSLRDVECSEAATASAEERWTQIGAALQAEADMLGFDKYDRRPPVGDYLASLAALKMPATVGKMQKSGGPKMGIIDVVVSAGSGKKFGPEAGYLSEPVRSVNLDYSVREENGGVQESGHGWPEKLYSQLGLIPQRATEGASHVCQSCGQQSVSRDAAEGMLPPTPPTVGLAKAHQCAACKVSSSDSVDANPRTPPLSGGVRTPRVSGDLSHVQQELKERPVFASLPTRTCRRGAAHNYRTFSQDAACTDAVRGLSDPFVDRSSDPVIRPAQHQRLTRSKTSRMSTEGKNTPVETPLDLPIARRHASEQNVSPTGFEKVQTEFKHCCTPSPLCIGLTSNLEGALSSEMPSSVASSIILQGSAGAEVLQSGSSVHESFGGRSRRKRSAQAVSNVPPSKRRRSGLKESPHLLPLTPSVDPQEDNVVPCVVPDETPREEGTEAHTSLNAPGRAIDLAIRNGAKPNGALVRRIILKARGTLLREVNLQRPLHLEYATSVTPLTRSTPFEPSTCDSAILTSASSMFSQAPVNEASSLPFQTPAKSRRIARHYPGSYPKVSVEDLSRSFVPPPSSHDSVVTYAEAGPWCDPASGGRGGPYRQIRSERAGYFKEDSIIMGVRYVIG